MKYLLFFMLVLFSLTSVSADGTLGSFPQDECISLYQMCSNCTYVNVTSITYPNSTIFTINQAMTKDGVDYNYTFCGTSVVGNYLYNTCGDKNGGFLCEPISFTIIVGTPPPQIPVFTHPNANVGTCADNTTATLSFTSYPYIAVNSTYTSNYEVKINNIKNYMGNISLNINGSIFNYTWHPDLGIYSLILIFTEEGDYPFTAYSNDSCLSNFSGTFIVRTPYNVEFCGYKQKNGAIYTNDFAYLIAEPTTSKKYYDDTLEQFITPLGFKSSYKTPVLHAYYRDGCGTLTFYEESNYAIRLFDGIATFPTTFSPPNITKTYGANIYLGQFDLSENDSIHFFLSDKDEHPFTWLINWIFIIVLGLAFVGSVFLFFTMPDKPAVSLIFGLGFISMVTIIRVVLYIWKGT